MRELKKIVIKGGLLIIALVVMNYIYKATLWQADLEEYSGLTDEIVLTKNADILYLGDCSDSYFGDGIKNEKGISQLLDSLLATQKVVGISEVGFHAGMYSTILTNVPTDSKIKTVIVTMNLRSFAATVQNTYVTNSINQRIRMLNNNYPPLLNRFLLSFDKVKYNSINELAELRERDWKRDQIEMGSFNTLYDWKTAYEKGEYIPFDEHWTEEMKAKGSSHIANYAFQIDTENSPRITNFDNIVALVKKRNWQLVFHLMPEKLDESKELVGTELTQLIAHNRKLLHQRYGKDGVVIVDNMELLEADEFIDELPNSHFHYKGRKLMAVALTQFLNENSNQ